mgnify:CR=1 FL=1
MRDLRQGLLLALQPGEYLCGLPGMMKFIALGAMGMEVDMRFYQVQADDDGEGGDCRWFTTRADAEREKRKIEAEDDPYQFEVRVFDVPTKKAELLAWLNLYGNPTGMGYN